MSTRRYAILAGDPAAVLARHHALLAKPWKQRVARQIRQYLG